jgi:hypothetical protein
MEEYLQKIGLMNADNAEICEAFLDAYFRFVEKNLPDEEADLPAPGYAGFASPGSPDADNLEYELASASVDFLLSVREAANRLPLTMRRHIRAALDSWCEAPVGRAPSYIEALGLAKSLSERS